MARKSVNQPSVSGKRNPADATGRNIRASNTKHADHKRRIDSLIEHHADHERRLLGVEEAFEGLIRILFSERNPAAKKRIAAAKKRMATALKPITSIAPLLLMVVLAGLTVACTHKEQNTGVRFDCIGCPSGKTPETPSADAPPVRQGGPVMHEAQPAFIIRQTNQVRTITLETFTWTNAPFDFQFGAATHWCSQAGLSHCDENRENWNPSTPHGYNPVFAQGSSGMIVYEYDRATHECGTDQRDINWKRVGAGPYTAANEGVDWGNMIGPSGLQQHEESCASSCAVRQSQSFVHLDGKSVVNDPNAFAVNLVVTAKNVTDRYVLLRWNGWMSGQPLEDGSFNNSERMDWPKEAWVVGSACDNIERTFELSFTPGRGDDADKAFDRGHLEPFGAVWSVEGVD